MNLHRQLTKQSQVLLNAEQQIKREDIEKDLEMEK